MKTLLGASRHDVSRYACRAGLGGRASRFSGFILQRYFCESFGFDPLQFDLRRLIFVVFRVVIIFAVTRWVLVTVAEAIVAKAFITWLVGIRPVLSIVVASAVARRVLVAIAPAVVVVIEINAGAFL